LSAPGEISTLVPGKLSGTVLICPRRERFEAASPVEIELPLNAASRDQSSEEVHGRNSTNAQSIREETSPAPGVQSSRSRMADNTVHVYIMSRPAAKNFAKEI
jgi:hypothetical protein